MFMKLLGTKSPYSTSEFWCFQIDQTKANPGEVREEEANVRP
jgi:hypothetical protein